MGDEGRGLVRSVGVRGEWEQEGGTGSGGGGGNGSRTATGKETERKIQKLKDKF